MLEFLKNTVPLLEDFLTLFQKSVPTTHLIYDSICLTLVKLMRRFIQPTALKGKYGAALGSVSCEDVKLQLTYNELVIDDQTRKALAFLNPAKQKLAILGIRTFYSATVSHLQLRLPLDNKLLRDLGCLNLLKRNQDPQMHPFRVLQGICNLNWMFRLLWISGKCCRQTKVNQTLTLIRV